MNPRQLLEKTGAAETDVGQSGSRDFGEVTLKWELLSGGWQLNATYFLSGELVGAHSFLPTTPTYDIEAAVGDQRLKGSFTVVFLDAPQLSTYSGDFRYGVKTSNEPLPSKFKGTITFWTVQGTFSQRFGPEAVNLSARFAAPGCD
ncbi:MAG: hypothetical protein KDD11_09080 [Acidobacteria bacterium]|nr:hypothetical protein [Acidobacteriota bacterium]